VADLERDWVDPAPEPARWAVTLAGWLSRRGPAEAKSWNELHALARHAGERQPPGTIWSADWMERLFDAHAMLRGAERPPPSVEAWRALDDLTGWARRWRLGRLCAKARPPRWWLANGADQREARGALLAHLGLPEAWSGPARGAEWGQAVARALRNGTNDEQRVAALSALSAAPETQRAGFVHALLEGWPGDGSEETLRWLKGQDGLDPEVLLPSEVRGAAQAVLGRGDAAPLRDVLARALASRSALTATLDALEQEARRGPGARSKLAPVLADALERARPAALAGGQRWALQQGEAAHDWLEPFLSRRFADPANREEWLALVERTPPELRPVLAQVVLRLTARPDLHDAYTWCVEEVLLRIPENNRPEDPVWAGLYLDRSPSDLRLIDRLFHPADGPRAVLDWLQRAHDRDELTDEHLSRLRNLRALHRALLSGDGRGLGRVDFTSVAVADRAALLGRLIARSDTRSTESLTYLLGWCRDAWPGAFSPGAIRLESLAEALAGAEVFARSRSEPAAWWQALGAVLDHLQLRASRHDGLEPDGLAAEMVAATSRLIDDEAGRWTFRRFVLYQEPGWRLLAGDVRRELRGHDLAGGLAVFRRWDDALDKGPWSHRFFEVFLNAAGDDLVAAIVGERASDLRVFDLAWWSFGQTPGASPDLRDRYARGAPLAPLDEARLAAVERWLFPVRRPAAPARASTTSDLVPLEPIEPPPSHAAVKDIGRLSAFARVRWRCVQALSEFVNAAGILSSARWSTLIAARDVPRIDQLDDRERYRFVAWLIKMTDELEVDLGLVPTAELAEWLWRLNVTDASRIEAGWARELEGLAEVPPELRQERKQYVSALCDRLALLRFRAGEAGRKASSTDSHG
jgi:hypothetical protein